MKTRNNRYYKARKTGLFAILLSLVGLGSVGCYGPLMYGTPSADFSVKGKVTDENGRPIPDLQVILGRRYYNSNSVTYDHTYFPIDTVKTGSDGIYRMTAEREFPPENLQVDVNDIDGEAGGGQFESSTLVIQNIQYEGGDGWYRGKADVKVPDIKLKKK